MSAQDCEQPPSPDPEPLGSADILIGPLLADPNGFPTDETATPGEQEAQGALVTEPILDRKRSLDPEEDNSSGRESKRQQKDEEEEEETEGGQPSQEYQDRETVFRLLVPATRVGAVIGKQGAIVREIRNATKARIRVCEGVPNCDERVIVISARDSTPEDKNQAQRALLEVHRRVVDAEVESREQAGKPINMLTRMLVNHTQVGSIIGKGGCITKDIRESTGAFCKILPQEDLPVCALHNDRVVLISGQAEQIKSALLIACRQIRDNPPREAPGGPPPSLTILCGYTGFGGHQNVAPIQAQYPYPMLHMPQVYQPAPPFYQPQSSGYDPAPPSYLPEATIAYHHQPAYE